jgi:photosystem II stability/assembly factor-like uncharacterized protein
VVAGQIVTNPLKIAGASVLQITSDGGKTWRLVYRPSGPVVSMSVVTPNHIWALAAQGYGKGAPTHLLASSDGGATWKRVGALQPGMKELAFVSRDLGYAVRLDVFHGGDHAPWTLVKTTDGGQTWQAVGRAAPAGTSAVAVSFVDPHQGWLLRMDQPGAGQQSRELLETRNGGHSWRRVAGTLSPSAIPASSTDGLGTGGYPGSLFFLADGHGWIGLNYAASVIATKDGGRHWQPAGSRLSDYGAGPVWFLNDRRGFAIVGSANDFRLLGTRNGGSSWAVVHKWVLPD